MKLFATLALAAMTAVPLFAASIRSALKFSGLR